MALIRTLLGSLAVLLVVFQYVTVAKLRVIPGAFSFLSFERLRTGLAERIDFTAVDAGLALAILALCVTIVVVELRGRRLTGFLRRVFTSEAQTVGLLLACAALFVRFYLAPGQFNWSADSPQHIAYTDITARILAAGKLPSWTYYLGTGSPYLQLYGFLFFWLTGGLAVLLGDTYLSLKLSLFSLHTLCALGAYAAARAGGCRRGPAFVAGLGYVLCFWHTQQILIMGRLHVALVYALLPWPFWGIERALRARRRDRSAGMRHALRYALLGGAALGLLILAHPGYGYWSCAFVSLYALARILPCGRADGWRPAALAATVIGVGVLVGAALVLPMSLDRAYTGLAGGYGLRGVPDPQWWHPIVWSNFKFLAWQPPAGHYNWYGGYLGLSLLLGACVCLGFLWHTALRPGALRRGVVHRLRRPRSWAPALAALVALLGGLVMVFGYRTWLVRVLPYNEILSAGRYQLFLTLFLALACGHGIRALQLWSRRRHHDNGHGGDSRRLVTFALLIVVADLGPTTFQHCYRDPQTADATGTPLSFYAPLKADAATYAERGELPEYRVMWSRGGLYRFLATGLYYHTDTAVPDGPHPGELRAVFDFVRPFEGLMSAAMSQVDRRDLSQVHIDYPVYAGLYLLNVRYLLVHREDQQSFRLTIDDAAPIAVSSSLSPPPASGLAATDLRDDVLDELVARSDPRAVGRTMRLLAQLVGMEVNPRERTCRTLYVDGLQEPIDLGTQPRVTLHGHRVRQQRVDIEVSVTERCFARLAYGYYPHVDVLVDGVAVPPRVTSAGFFLLDLEAGRHEIVLEPHLSTLRTALLLLSAVVLVAILVYYRRAA